MQTVSALYLAACQGHEKIFHLLWDRLGDEEKNSQLRGQSDVGDHLMMADILKINQLGAPHDMTESCTAAQITLSRGLPQITIKIIQGCAGFMSVNTLASLCNQAIAKGNLAVLKTINESGIDFVPSYITQPAQLVCAITQGYADIAEYLLTQGVDIERVFEGLSPVMYAIAYRQDAIYAMLAERGANLEVSFPPLYVPLELSVNPYSHGLVMQAIERKCDLTTLANLSRRLPEEFAHASAVVKLLVASQQGCLPSLKETLTTGVNINSHWNDYNPLKVAIHFKQEHIANYLLSQGANPNYAMPNGQSLLRVAMINGMHTTMVHLIQAGANPFAKDNFDRLSPIRLAYNKDDIHSFDLILKTDKATPGKLSGLQFFVADDKAKSLAEVRAQNRQQAYRELFQQAYRDQGQDYLESLIESANTTLRQEIEEAVVHGENTALNEKLLPFIDQADSSACNLQ